MDEVNKANISQLQEFRRSIKSDMIKPRRENKFHHLIGSTNDYSLAENTSNVSKAKLRPNTSFIKSDQKDGEELKLSSNLDLL